MQNGRYLVTLELAFVYTILASALLFSIISESSNSTSEIAQDVPTVQDAGMSIPLEPIDNCLCDSGLKIAINTSNACGCQDGKGHKCTCDSCECTSCQH